MRQAATEKKTANELTVEHSSSFVVGYDFAHVSAPAVAELPDRMVQRETTCFNQTV